MRAWVFFKIFKELLYVRQMEYSIADQKKNPRTRMDNNVKAVNSTSSNSKDESNLTTLLKQFISINTNISDLKSQIKELTIRSKEVESQILTIMNEHNLQNIDTQTNVIQIKTTTTKKAINQKSLVSYFVSQLNIPQDTIRTFVEQIPSKTVQTLCIKPK